MADIDRNPVPMPARRRGLRHACVAAGVLLLAAWLPAQAQNLIANPGFENNPPPANGNNIGWSFSPWILGPGDQSNVVKVDGPGGFNYAASGPQSDASNNGAGAGAGVAQHYADIVGSNDFYQTFTVPTCGGAPGQTRTATFSGWFSTRDNLSGTGAIEIRAGVGDGGTLLARQPVSLPAPTPPLTSGTAPWTFVTGTVSVQSGSQISYVVEMSNNVNFDEASLVFNAVTCVTSAVTLRKTWVDAYVNDGATLTATRNGSVIDTFPSVANAFNETDTDATPFTAFQGEVVQLAETLAPGNTGSYAASLACTGGGTLSGTTLTIGASGAPTTCTWTNRGAAVADLAITKTNTPGSGPNDLPSDTVQSGAASNYSIVVRNNGPAGANNAVVRDPAPTNLTCTTASCGSATGGAACPASISVAALQSTAGVAIPTLPAGGSVTITLGCTVN